MKSGNDDMSMTVSDAMDDGQNPRNLNLSPNNQGSQTLEYDCEMMQTGDNEASDNSMTKSLSDAAAKDDTANQRMVGPISAGERLRKVQNYIRKKYKKELGRKFRYTCRK